MPFDLSPQGSGHAEFYGLCYNLYNYWGGCFLKKTYLFLLSTLTVLSFFSWNCSKTYTFTPVSPAVIATPTPTPVPGTVWVEATANAAFPGRGAHTSLVYNNNMWVIGGYNGTLYYNDVWNSADGVNWNESTASAAFSARDGQASVVYNSAIWVIAGAGTSLYNDVWSSTNGST